MTTDIGVVFKCLSTSFKYLIKLPGRIRTWWREFIATAKKTAIDLLITVFGIVLTDPIIIFIIGGILLYRYLHQLFDVAPQ